MIFDNRAPDGYPLMYSMPHPVDCPCVTCLVSAELPEIMARYFDEHPIEAE